MSGFKGASLSEYFLILFLVAVVTVPSVIFLGNTFQNGMNETQGAHKAGVKTLLTILEPKNTKNTLPLHHPNPYGKSQPISTLAFDYNKQTGLVKIISATNGTEVSSGEGTARLVQGLIDIRTNYPNSLTPVQDSLLTQLINRGLRIADEEQRLFDYNIGGYKTGNITNLKFFPNQKNKVRDSSLYSDFTKYTDIYNRLKKSITNTDTTTLEMLDVIETNSTLISQLAVENFISPQHKADGRGSNVIEPKMIKEKGIDIVKVTVDKTAKASRNAFQKALQKMKKKR